jgi:quercetin dioxygenase-like cupin family protein
MKRLLIALALSTPCLFAQQVKNVPLIQKDLTGIAGKEAVMSIVDVAPGKASAVHRHNADVFVYVLEGAMVMQVRGKAAEILHAGQTFYESPNDVHVVSKNASDKDPAKFLVFMVKEKGAPTSVPAQ